MFDSNMEKKNHPSLQFKVGTGQVIKVRSLVGPCKNNALNVHRAGTKLC